MSNLTQISGLPSPPASQTDVLGCARTPSAAQASAISLIAIGKMRFMFRFLSMNVDQTLTDAPRARRIANQVQRR
ncbi:MAG: hypothetical protein C4547_03650 [Phycisphaerales bacterium]|nr:MAG: hypothetical protein C4547_03650 [Phycisphaerales bacterium]